MAENNTPKLPSNASRMSGRTGTTIFKGYITGEEYNYKLQGTNGLRIYDMMRNDAAVRQMLQVVKLPIQSTTFIWEPPKDDPQAEDKKDYINDQLKHRNIKFNQLKKDAMLMLDFGYSLFEFTLHVFDFKGKARIGVKELEWRKPTSIIKWETEDGKPGVTQQLIGDTNEHANIDEIRLLRFTHDQEGQNYVGKSLLRYVYKNWDIREKLEIIDAMKHERHGMGVVKIGVEPGQTPDASALEKAEEIARNLRAMEDSFIRSAEGVTMEMMDMMSSSTTDIIPSMNYHDARIAKAAIAGFLEIGGQSGSGSQSLSKDLTSLFMKAEETLAKNFAEAINEKLIRLLLDLNYTDNSFGYGELKHGSISDEDPSVLSASLKSLKDAGMITPGPDLEEYIRDSMGLPEMSEELKDNWEEKHTVVEPVDPTTTPPSKTKDVDDKKLDKEKETKDKAEKDIKASIETAKEVVRRIDVAYIG